VRPVLPDPDDRTRCAAVGDDLPSVDTAFDPDATATTSVAVVALLAELGLEPWYVDCVIDQTDDSDLGGRPREVLVELPPPPHGWRLPNGWRWRPIAELDPDLSPGLATMGRERLAELAGRRPVPALRTDWSRPGWFPRAEAWISERLEAAGRPPPVAVVPFRLWGLSAVMRVDLPHGCCWFKAAFEPFRHEPAITELLHSIAGGHTTPVIAADATRAWLLVDDLGQTEVRGERDTRRAIEELVDLQRRATAHLDELVAVGCPRRPIEELAERVGAGLASDVARSIIAVDSSTSVAVLEGLTAAIDRVRPIGFPETLVHGDFHPGNVAATDDGIVIFDWSDGCVSMPAVDAATWMWWFRDDPVREAAVWSWFVDAWERGFGIDGSQLDRRAIEAVAAGFHFVSYVGILESLEPIRRREVADGLVHFADLLRRSLA
jgi:hypothetical protein